MRLCLRTWVGRGVIKLFCMGEERQAEGVSEEEGASFVCMGRGYVIVCFYTHFICC